MFKLFVYTVAAPLMDTLISRQLYLEPPSQNPVLLNSVFSNSSKRVAPATDILFSCPKGVHLRELRLYSYELYKLPHARH